MEDKIVSRIWLGLTLVMIGSISVVQPSYANVFEANQKTSTRTSLELDGCYAENMAIGRSASTTSNDVLYVACNSANGMFVSRDNAQTWEAPAVGSDFGAIIDVAASTTPGTAFMIGGIKLFGTTDSGKTWTDISGQYNDFGQTMEYADGILMAAYRQAGQVAVSYDDGKTVALYTVDAAAQYIADIAYSPMDDTWYILAGTSGNYMVYKSTTAGTTWSAIGKSGDYESIAAHPAMAGTLYIAGRSTVELSTNSGTSWTTIKTTTTATQSLLVTEAGRVYLGTEYTDNNATWTAFQSIEKDSVIKGNFIKNDTVNNRLYIQSGRGVAYSEDGGVTWHDTIDGMEGVTVFDLSQDSTKEVVWLAAQGGFVKSTNFYSSILAGTAPTWSDFILPDTDSNDNSNIDNTDAVWVDPVDPNLVLAVALQSMWRSTDGGITWTRVTIDLESSNRSRVVGIVQDPNSGTLYIAYYFSEGPATAPLGGGVLASSDAGVTWTNLALPNVPASALTIDSAGRVVVGVGTENDTDVSVRGVYVFDGSSWVQRGLASTDELYGKQITDVYYEATLDRVYATYGPSNDQVGGGVLVSTTSADAWTTWSQFSTALPEDAWPRSVATADAGKTVYIASMRPAGTGYIFKCDDTGKSCGTFYTGLIDESFHDIIFDDFVSAGTGIFRYKSKAKLAAVKKEMQEYQYSIAATLTDSTTKEKLNKKVVRLFKKTHGKYVLVDKQKTRKGKVQFTVGGGKYQLRWKPRSSDDVATYPKLVKSKILKFASAKD